MRAWFRILRNAPTGAILGNYSRIDNIASRSNKLDVTAPLTSFDEACGLKPALDLAKGLRAKPLKRAAITNPAAAG
jgi:hypothetical protein